MTVKIYTITWDDWFKAIKRSRTTSLYILFKFNNKILTHIANLNRTDEESTIYKVLYKVIVFRKWPFSGEDDRG